MKGIDLLNYEIKAILECLNVGDWEVDVYGDWILSFENPNYDANNISIGDWVCRDVDIFHRKYADFHVESIDDGEWDFDTPGWKDIPLFKAESEDVEKAEPHYTGCSGCVHYDQQQTALICRDCKRSYSDMYEDGEEA